MLEENVFVFWSFEQKRLQNSHGEQNSCPGVARDPGGGSGLPPQAFRDQPADVQSSEKRFENKKKGL